MGVNERPMHNASSTCCRTRSGAPLRPARKSFALGEGECGVGYTGCEILHDVSFRPIGVRITGLRPWWGWAQAGTPAQDWLAVKVHVFR